MNTLELKNISYYKDNKDLSNISFKFLSDNNYSIVGSSTSSKKTIVDILRKDIINFDGDIFLNDVLIDEDNINILDDNISVLTYNDKLDNIQVIDLLFNEYNKIFSDEEKTKEEVEKLVKLFQMKDYLNYKVDDLNINHKILINILINIINNKPFLIIDNLFSFLKRKEIDNIYKLAKKNNVCIINISSDLDDVLNSDYLIVLYLGKIAIEGNTLSCLKEEKIIKRLGFKIPFMIDLSIQLNYYGVISGIYNNKKDIMEKIWN